MIQLAIDEEAGIRGDLAAGIIMPRYDQIGCLSHSLGAIDADILQIEPTVGRRGKTPDTI